MKPCDVLRATGRNSWLIAAAGALAAALTVGGCASGRSAGHGGDGAAAAGEGGPTVAEVNAYCPVSGDHPVGENKRTSADLTRMWRGERVGFCCDQCPPWWDEMTDAEREKTLRSVKELERTRGVDSAGSLEATMPAALELEQREGPLFR